MTYLSSWEEFEKCAERLYLQDPMKVGINWIYANPAILFIMKYLVSSIAYIDNVISTYFIQK